MPQTNQKTSWLKSLYSTKFLLILLLAAMTPLAFVQVKSWQITKAEALRKEEIERQKNYEIEEDARLATAVEWPMPKIVSAGIDTLILKTKYSNGNLYYRLTGWSLKNFNEGGKAPFQELFRLEFTDADGFKLADVALDVSGYIKLVDNQGVIVGFRFEGQHELDRQLYKRIADVRLRF